MISVLALSFVLAACGGSAGGSQGGGEILGSINVEGSSTVQPITQAAAEAFNQQNRDVQITVGGAGTGDGFQAFCSGETQIADASRPINDEEQQNCESNGVEFIELAVAQDGVTVVANPQNTFADNITLEQLRTLWEPDAEGQVDSWNDINPEWPDQQVTLYGPGTESGTFEFFTEKAVGKKKESRTDYQASEDDNVLVQGVAGDPNALGYFGFGYFEQNQNRLKALTVDGVTPSAETINSGQYPLARPLFIYVLSTQALEQNPSVEEFVNFYLENLNQFVQQAQYVPLSDQAVQETRERFQNRTTGSAPEVTKG